jgi:hypothetical protein
MHHLQPLWNLPGGPSVDFGPEQSPVREVNDRIAELAGAYGERSSALRLSAAPCYLTALRPHRASFLSRYVHLNRPAASIVKRDSDLGTLAVLNRLTTDIANHYCLASHSNSLRCDAG